MTNILVTGSNGQLGLELKKVSKEYLNYKFLFSDIDSLDITDFDAVRHFIIQNKIEVILNCAAYTAVDQAEDNVELADLVNHLAVYNIAKICNERKIKLIHISTDYVFDGNGKVPYLETDNPNPISIYGKTKLDGELAIIKINLKNSIIIRTSWVYSNFGNNFLKTMLRHAKTNMELNIICDQFGSPTYAKNLANVMLEILPNINNTSPEIFNYSNKGFCSWYEFAEAIFKYSGSNIILNPIQSDDYSTKARRPFFSVLDKTKIEKKYKLRIPHWKEALKNCIDELNQSFE